MAATALITLNWKSQEALVIEAGMVRVRWYMCLISTLLAICRYRSGQGNALKGFEVQWSCFVDCKVNLADAKMRDQVLTIM